MTIRSSIQTRRRAALLPKRSLLASALVSCLLVASGGALAQSTSATLRGQVVQGTQAAAAEVTLTNVASGFSRSVQAQADGSYSVPGLPPGTYRVDVRSGEQTSSQTITLRVGQTATLDLPVAAAVPADTTTLDTIEVVGTSVVRGTRPPRSRPTSRRSRSTALPQNSRNFLAFADIVPGVQFDREGADGSTSLRGRVRRTSNGINVFIDGVGQKNYVLKGGISGQDSSRGSPFPQSAIGEYKVITQNYKAEFDQISSAAVVAVTKSGTNEFDGNVVLRPHRPTPGARTATPNEQIIPARTPSRRRSSTASASAARSCRTCCTSSSPTRPRTRVDPRDVTLGENVDISASCRPSIAALLGSTGAPFNMDLYFGKLTWSPDESNLVELTAKYRTESEITGLGGVNASTYGSSKDNEETRIDLRWQYSAENWINDAHISPTRIRSSSRVR
jgi:hypothetical protein